MERENPSKQNQRKTTRLSLISSFEELPFVPPAVSFSGGTWESPGVICYMSLRSSSGVLLSYRVTVAAEANLQGIQERRGRCQRSSSKTCNMPREVDLRRWVSQEHNYRSYSDKRGGFFSLFLFVEETICCAKQPIPPTRSSLDESLRSIIWLVSRHREPLTVVQEVEG